MLHISDIYPEPFDRGTASRKPTKHVLWFFRNLSARGVFGTLGDDGLQGHVILARSLAKIGVEGVIADRQGEVVRAGVFALLLPDATAFD